MIVHLIDGTYELFRVFFGAPRATTRDGREVGATRALLRSLAAFLRRPDVTHVACAFDHVVESFRNQLYPFYKTGEGLDPALATQFELAEDAARAAGCVVWPMIEFEADDALAAAAHRFAADPSVEKIVICSPDKDLTQCVREQRVVCWDRLRDRVLDAPGVVAKFGVTPESIPDYLALVGDAADGYPGVPRWGARSAALLLARYVRLESIPRSERDWDVPVRGAAALAQSLTEHYEAALLYRTLATLRTDVPLAESLVDLEWRGPELEHLRVLCERIEDASFADGAAFRPRA